MKKNILFQTQIFIFLTVLSFIISGVAYAQQAIVSAYLDSDCDHHRGEIVVPQGFIAIDFSGKINSSWMPCAGPEPPRSIGYSICLFQGYEYGRAKYAAASYSYTLYKNREWQESPGPLAKLVLPPGTYHVLVGGGKNTEVTIKYNLIKQDQKPIQPKVSHLSCENKDNDEKACCCFKSAHTYRFAQYVSSIRVRFDTGRGFNCKSTVQLQIDRGKGSGWETVKTIEAVSSSGNSELNIIKAEVPVNDTIYGFRIFDGGVCCIDFSEIFLK